jgi:predicted RNA-binding protein with PUA-like domain
MEKGDRLFIYHSGGGSASQISGIVGLADIRGAGRPDPKNPKSAVVDVQFKFRWIRHVFGRNQAKWQV